MLTCFMVGLPSAKTYTACVLSPASCAGSAPILQTCALATVGQHNGWGPTPGTARTDAARAWWVAGGGVQRLVLAERSATRGGWVGLRRGGVEGISSNPESHGSGTTTSHLRQGWEAEAHTER